MSVTVPVTEAAQIFAAEVRERSGLLVRATPLPSDEFLVYPDENLTWRQLERRFPQSPLRWWYDRPRNRPIADALAWFVTKGFVIGGEPTGGRLVFATEDGDTLLRCFATGTASYYRNVLIQLTYLLHPGDE